MSEPNRIASALLPGPRSLWVERPAASRGTDCLVVLDGELYRERVCAPQIIGEQVAAGCLPPLTCVYVAADNGAARHAELTCKDPFTEFLATDLVDWIEHQVGPQHRYWLCGLSLSGLAVAYAAVQHPGIFRGAVCQSPSAWWNDEWLAANLAQPKSLPGRFWISVGDQELDEGVSHPPTGLRQRTSQLASCNKLALKLAEHGATVRYSKFAGGHDPACWARELPTALAWLLGPGANPPSISQER